MHETPVPPAASRRPSRSPAAVVVATAFLAIAGCRTGSWTPPSTWSMFGSSSKATGGLTDAPGYAQGPAKPSATATPYPTTSTPESYVITDGPASRSASPSSPGTAATATAASVGSVVYGSTPPQSPPSESRSASADARYASLPPASGSGQGSAGSFAAQVGPYASTTGPTVRPSPDDLPGGIAAGDDPAARLVGDRRPSGGEMSAVTAPGAAAGSWATPPAAADSSASFAGPAEDSRYAAGGSRFSGFGGDASPPPVDRPQDGFPQQSFPRLGSEAPAAVPAAPAALGPPGMMSPAMAPPAMAPPAMAPPAMAPPTSPSFGSPPSRRPDPGYRPGGTSSYQPRPGGVGGSTGVQTVGFESPLPR
jgi:hypothetical protein